MTRSIVCFLCLAVLCAVPAKGEIVRTDRYLDHSGLELWLREVRDDARDTSGPPLLLIHGARVPGEASFDLPVAGGSLAADLARRGLHVFIADLEGYGFSGRPPEMTEPRRASAPLVRSDAAVRSLATIVDGIRERTGEARVAILGWATGGHWAGHYASIHPRRVSHLVFLNSLYGYTDGHELLGRGTSLEDPEQPGRFNVGRFMNYRLNAADSLSGGWDRSIPLDDKSRWRDPVVLEAYEEKAIASDPTAADRDPPSFRAPSGALADSFLLATGAALWDARLTTAHALIVRSGNDFWSRPEDAVKLREHLELDDTRRVEVLELGHATHFVHLDRPARHRSDRPCQSAAVAVRPFGSAFIALRI